MTQSFLFAFLPCRAPTAPRRRTGFAALLVLHVLGGAAAALEPAGISAAGDPKVLLLDHARWCHDARLFEGRDRAYQALIALDPDEAEARRFLKHRREADGSWKVEQRPSAARNRNAAALAEHERMRARLLDELRQLAQARFDAAGDDGARRAAWSTVLAFAPDDGAAHLALDEARWEPARGEPRWVLVDALRARERRAELRELVATARADGAGVRSGSEDPLAGVVIDAPPRLLREVEATRATMTAALEIAAAALARTRSLPEGLVVHLLDGPEEGERFVARFEEVPAARRRDLGRLASYWIPGRPELVIAAPRAAERVEQALMQTVMTSVGDLCGIGGGQGWVAEGLALVASELVLGRPIALLAREQVDAVWYQANAALPAERALREEALAHLEAGGEQALIAALERPVARMDRADFAVAALVVGYLAEAAPVDLGHVAYRVGLGTPPDAVLREELGRAPADLIQHLRRWHAELVRIEAEAPPQRAARASARR